MKTSVTLTKTQTHTHPLPHTPKHIREHTHTHTQSNAHSNTSTYMHIAHQGKFKIERNGCVQRPRSEGSDVVYIMMLYDLFMHYLTTYIYYRE